MKKIYSAIFILVMATACQEDGMTPDIAASSEMSFNVLSPSVYTKVSGDIFEAMDEIGLYVTDYADAATPMPLQVSGNRASNLSVTYDGSVWTPSKTIYWGEGKSDVYAYYPYIPSLSDVEDLYFEVSSDQTSEGYEDSDFLWAKAEGVIRSGGAVNLQMRHVMSKLTVKIIAGDDYVGSLPDDASVLLHGTVTGARIDLANGAVSKDPYSGAKSIRMKKLGIRTFEGVDAVVYEAVVVPQMLETSVPLLEINSKSVSYLLEDSFNFRSGVAYTYTAVLNTSTTAIKVEIGCELEDWNSTGGDNTGDGGTGGEGDGGEEDDDGKTYTDLSAEGTANCYLVQAAGDYKFRAVLGNTDATVGNVKSVEVLWESFGTDEMPNVGDLVASASYKDGYIRFSTPETFRDGNAVIAAKNSKGTILWSWHIWCAEEGWQEQVYYNDAGTMMDRNLGATSATPGEVEALGLLYQWGRKDPFLGSSSISSSEALAASTGTWSRASGGNQKNSDTNPTTFYTQMYLPDGNWASEKTAYDPCPAGWRVPEGGDAGVWAKASEKTADFYDNSMMVDGGLNFSKTLGDAEMIYYPVSGYLNLIGSPYGVGGFGYYWYCTPNETNNSSAYNLYFSYNGNVYPSNLYHRGYGSSVRCLQE